MILERLAFGDDKLQYDAEEISIHVTRYQAVKNIVKGKKVLDIACGEGYGSYLLKKWGAVSVTGVDIDHESITNAKQHFGSEDINFIVGDATRLALKQDKFDVIVSLETIEHVDDPVSFLSSLNKLIVDTGTIIISCPNDHWYYDENESNPFHQRKYTFTEFKELVEPVLGKPKCWYVGTNVAGFANYVVDSDKELSTKKSDLQMLEIVRQQDMVVSAGGNVENALPNDQNCLYYFGVWGDSSDFGDPMIGVNIFPIHPFKMRISAINDYRTMNDNQNKLLEEYKQYIKTLERRIDQYTKGIHKQNQMVTARDEAIKSMESLIKERDEYIKQLESKINNETQ